MTELRPVLMVVAAMALLAAALWSRSVMLRVRFLRRMAARAGDADARLLATGALARDVHATSVYLVVAVTFGVAAITQSTNSMWLGFLLVIPVASTVLLSQYARRDARLSEQRLERERRAEEVLGQADTAPLRWAERLAPAHLPPTPGYEIATAHQAVSGVMSGDLVDVFVLPGGRVCCVVGDVAGHDVEASITALQTKFILRSYLRRYRDPGQALEELNAQLADLERPEEFISVFVAIFDIDAGTVRYASAGHPPGWICHERSPRALASTGPLLMIDASASYFSRELSVVSGDTMVLSTDGLSESRRGDSFFGEERVAALIRRESDASPQVMCKTLLEAASDFAQGGLGDDITVLAVRLA